MPLSSPTSFLACDNFCRLLITFANSLDPDQDWQKVGPDLDPKYLTLIYSWKKYFEKVNFEKKVNRGQQKHEKLPSMQRAYNLPHLAITILLLAYCCANQEWQWRHVLFTIAKSNISLYTPLELAWIDRINIQVIYRLQVPDNFVNKTWLHCHSWLAWQ